MRGLALQGGGAKGAYQVGAILAFNKRGIKFDGAMGTSIGAINAAFYASSNINGLYKLWLTTDCEKLFGFETAIVDAFDDGKINKNYIIKGIESIAKIIKNKGIDTSPIRKLLEKNISEKKLRKSKIDYGLVTFRIKDLKPIKITIKDIPEGKLIDYIIASAYLPCFKFEKIIDNSFYFDGGIYDNCPVDMFMDAGYDEIYVVKAWEGEKLKYKKKLGTKVVVISCREKLGSILSFSPRKAKRKINLGYYDTLRALDNLDGDKYYFKKYNENYYSSLFSSKDMASMRKKYGNLFTSKSNKKFIISIIEQVCDEFKIQQFKVYNMPFLITKLKYKMVSNKNSKFYSFIDKIKVKFE